MTSTSVHVPRLEDAPALSLGAVALTVADLARSTEYYRTVIGLRVLNQAAGYAALGADTPLVELHEEAGAAPANPGYAGLYHLAILLPSRADLGRFVAHLIAGHTPVQGASDHLVSEAIYLQDPDGHGIEVYADRDAASWNWQGGQVSMDTRAADIAGIVASAGTDTQWRGVPAGTVMGHVHLRVSDLSVARDFYSGLLGLDVVADLSQHGALFVSQGGYHHHFGLNVWQSRGRAAARSGEARLLWAQTYLPRDELELLRTRLMLAGLELTEAGEQAASHGFMVADPSGNLLRFGLKT